jgi:hypothetical protein
MYGQQLLALSWQQHTPGPDLLAQLTCKALHQSVVAMNCAPVRRELTRSWLSWVLQGRVAAVAQAWQRRYVVSWARGVLTPAQATNKINDRCSCVNFHVPRGAGTQRWHRPRKESCVCCISSATVTAVFCSLLNKASNCSEFVTANRDVAPCSSMQQTLLHVLQRQHLVQQGIARSVRICQFRAYQVRTAYAFGEVSRALVQQSTQLSRQYKGGSAQVCTCT